MVCWISWLVDLVRFGWCGWFGSLLIGWLADWLVSWFAGWSAGWLAGWLVDWLVGWFSGWLVGWWLVGYLVWFGFGFGLVWFGLVWFDLICFVLFCFDLGWFCVVWLVSWLVWLTDRLIFSVSLDGRSSMQLEAVAMVGGASSLIPWTHPHAHTSTIVTRHPTTITPPKGLGNKLVVKDWCSLDLPALNSIGLYGIRLPLEALGVYLGQVIDRALPLRALAIAPYPMSPL